MKTLLFLFIIFAFSLNGFSQTEKIAHRSHSGKDAAFRIRGNGNWGISPEMIHEQQKRDSAMKARADSIARKLKADSIAPKIKSGDIGKQRSIDKKQKANAVKKQPKTPVGK